MHPTRKCQREENVVTTDVRMALARIIHDGLSRNRGVAERDRRVEPRETEAYLKQYVEVARGEPACWHAVKPHASLSQRRGHDCSRTAHE